MIFGLPKSGLISEVVLISRKDHLGLAKTGLYSEVVLNLNGLNSEILLYIQTITSGKNNITCSPFLSEGCRRE